jgi:hypothetical protein
MGAKTLRQSRNARGHGPLQHSNSAMLAPTGRSNVS